MNYRWVFDKTLYLVDDTDTNNFILPTARQIFDFIFKAVDFISFDFSNHPEEYGISFCKYPLRLKVKLEPLYNRDSIIFLVQPYAYNSSIYKKVEKVNGIIADHIIVNNTWYPFEQNEFRQISAFLKKYELSIFDEITLKDVLPLIRDIEFCELFYELEFDYSANFSSNIDQYPDSKWFKGNLYPYQVKGYKWLKLITDQGLGGILGDEMGLGKTIQIIALFSQEARYMRKPNIVVCPSSLLENWRREIYKFAPRLKVCVHRGNLRTGYYRDLLKYDVVVTSYDVLIRDFSMFEMITWNLAVADEAQYIKNNEAKRSEALRNLKKRCAIAVTGTPIENHIKDIWAITEFAVPNYFGDFEEFNSVYTDDTESAKRLKMLISPLLLRRRVTEVADDLPSKITIPQVIEMNSGEAEQYEQVRKEIKSMYGKSATLVSIGILRQLCSHPVLLDDKADLVYCHSTKYERFTEIIDEIKSINEKVIIFTSYQKMADIILRDIEKRYKAYCRIIDGRTDGVCRQGIIDEFSQTQGFAALVLNPRAAGVGLNITSANHVIHYNLEWNPALEDQASARSYRRGQTKPVTIHRLFYANTVEEIINERIEGKRNLIETAVVGHEGDSNTMDIIAALDISPVKHLEGLK